MSTAYIGIFTPLISLIIGTPMSNEYIRISNQFISVITGTLMSTPQIIKPRNLIVLTITVFGSVTSRMLIITKTLS